MQRFLKRQIDLPQHAPGRIQAHVVFYGLLIGITLCPQILFASTLQEAQEKARALKLADQPIWRNLLYVEGVGHESAVVSPDYFLAKNGRYDPQAELMATIDAFYKAEVVHDRSDPRCIFPARYFWLSKFIDIPVRNLREETCMTPERWRAFDHIKSISLMMVSGYWGNPASTFGHAFLRMNVKTVEDPHDLFDLTINYGAVTPDHENPFVYAMKGLFGGYAGVFSDQYFYTQDLTYTRTEFRDIWDFQLNLTEDERTLLIYHVWEITGKKFKYYFLTQNCAYRLAALIDLPISDDVISRLRPWYIPEELFIRLKSIDEARIKKTGKPLIESVNYIPSTKRSLFYEIKRLSINEIRVFNKIVYYNFVGMPSYLNQLETGSQIKVLNALLAYQKYRIIADGKKVTEQTQQIKDQILLARLQLPARKEPSLNIPKLDPPSDGSPPTALRLAVGMGREGDAYLRTSFSPFKKEFIGQNSLEGDEFAIADMHIGFLHEQHKVFVDQFDLIRIINLETMPVDVIQDGKISWEMRIGVDRVEKDNRDYHDVLASAGVGKAYQLNNYFIVYAMLDLSAHSVDAYGRLKPYVGLRFDHGAYKAAMYGGSETTDYTFGMRGIWGGKMQYALNKRYSLNLEYHNDQATQLSVGMSLYW